MVHERKFQYLGEEVGDGGVHVVAMETDVKHIVIPDMKVLIVRG